MGATLTGTRISDTYDSLLKATDNGIITSSAKQITDGVGTNTPLYISTSRIGIGVSPTTTFQVSGNSKIGGDLTVTGNLLVEGTTTTVDTDTLSVKDPLIIVGNDNNTSDLVDLGFYGLYDTSGSQDLYAGLYRSASDTKFHLFKDLQEEPTTTVNTGGTGYTVASLVANLEGTLTGTIASSTVATTQSANDNSTKVATTAYVDNQVGLYDTLAEVLAGGNTSGANDIIMEDSQKVNYGTGSDLQIYHDATDSYIKNDTGNLIIEQTTDDADIVFKNDDGSGGTIEYFRIDGSESRVVYGRSIHMADNVSIFLGNDDDGLIRYDSTANKILYTGTSQFSGDVDFANNVTIPETPTADTHAASKGYVDAAVEGQDTLAEILAIGNTTGGTDISVSSGDDITFADNSKIILGDGSDVEMYWNGGTFVIETETFLNGTSITTNVIRAGSGTHQYIDFNQATQRFYSLSNERLQVNQTGVTVSGDLTVDLNTLFVDASANSVGINLTNPSDYTADELVISVPDGSGMTLVSGTTDAAYISFQSSTGAIATNGGFIGYDHDADGLTMFAQSKVSVAILEAEVAYFTDTAFFVDKNTTIDGNLTVNGNSTFAGQVIASSSSSGDYVRMYGGSGTAQWDIYGNGENLRISENSGGGGHVDIDTNLIVDGNVGIGTTSPSGKLDVESTSSDVAFFTSTQATTTNVYITNSNATANNTANLYFAPANNVAGSYIKSTAIEDFSTAANRTSDLRFGVRKDGTFNEAVIIDSSGNVGIGTDSPISYQNYRYLQINGGNTTQGGIVRLTTSDGSYVNEFAVDSSGGYISSSSNFLLYTQNQVRLYVNSGGNVGIGTSSPSEKLTISASNSGGANNNTLRFVDTDVTTQANQSFGKIEFETKDTNNAGVNAFINAFSEGTGGTGALSFGTGSAGSTERMRIDSSGVVSVVTGNLRLDGTAKLYTNNDDLTISSDDNGNGSGARIIFRTVNQERMRIADTLITFPTVTELRGDIGSNKFAIGNMGDASSQMMVSSRGFLTFNVSNTGSAKDATERMRITSGGDIQIPTDSAKIQLKSSGSSSYTSINRDASNNLVVRNTASNSIFSLENGGNLVIGGTLTQGSDISYKENIKPLESQLDIVNKLNPVSYNRIGQKENEIGFIAQEVEKLIPDLVYENPDGLKSLAYGNMTSILVKAIQELKAEIELLKTQINN